MLKLPRLRTDAFHAQKGQCCFCSLPMWNTSPDELKPFGLRAKKATPLHCTAEHLVAEQEGGNDLAGNIAAACWLCNTRRHKRKSPPSPRPTAPSCRNAWRRGGGTRPRLPPRVSLRTLGSATCPLRLVERDRRVTGPKCCWSHKGWARPCGTPATATRKPA